MKMNLLAIYVCACFIIPAISCSKDDSRELKKNKKELIVGTWQVIARTDEPALFDYDQDGANDRNSFLHLESCRTDDQFTFHANGTYTDNEGPTKCDPSDPQEYGGGSWTISADEKTLSSDGIEVVIIDINESTMTLAFDETDGNQRYRQISTYARVR